MTFDVAIIGAGPVGLTLANLLARRGVDVAVLEKRRDIYPMPRAIHFDGEAMRIFQATGLADAILPHTFIGKGMRFVDAAGAVLIDWSRAQEIGPMGWFESYRFHQPSVEQVLRDGLKRFPNATLRLGTEVMRVDGHDLSLADGKTIQARFIVACDGASSPTREVLGIGLHDLGFQERWLVVDALLLEPRPDLGDHSIQYCDPDAPCTYVRGAGDWAAVGNAASPRRPGSHSRGRRVAKAVAVDQARRGRAWSRRHLHLPLSHCKTVACRATYARRRCRASDATLHGPRHVRRTTRCSESVVGSWLRCSMAMTRRCWTPTNPSARPMHVHSSKSPSRLGS